MRKILSLLLLSTAISCAAQEPGTSGNTNPGSPDAGAEVEPETDGPVILEIGVQPTQTYWDTIPLVGRGPRGGTVLVEGSNGSVPVEASSDGTFCVDVPLSLGVANTLTVLAIDEDGKRSETKSVEVLQFGEPPKPGEATPAANAAKGGLVVQGTMEEEDGVVASITDGDLSTSVVYQNAVWGADWFIVQMPAQAGVEKLRVYSSEECKMRGYLIHTATSVETDMAAPSSETLDKGPWTFRGQYSVEGIFDDAVGIKVSDCSTGQLACQEFGFLGQDNKLNPEVIGAIGIRLTKDSCLNFAGLGEHDIHEIEARTPVGIAPPGLSAPTCKSGG